jgi:putative endonuclease
MCIPRVPGAVRRSCAAPQNRDPHDADFTGFGYELAMEGAYFVYILASKKNGTLYAGVTNNLARRLTEHKAKLVPGFTRKYNVEQLVYFEACSSILEARAREHSLKRWRRAWKIALIEKNNPDWQDLSDRLNA